MASAMHMASTSRPAVEENSIDESDGHEEEYLEENIKNIYLHLCNEEGREFTGVTTFHGMIRIFTSRNWTSLIFWVIVVSTSLVFFMIFSGYILSNYAMAKTYMRKSRETYIAGDVTISICGSPKIPQIQNVHVYSSIKSRHSKGNCLEMTMTPVRNHLFMYIKEDLLTSEMYLLISPSSIGSSSRIYLRSRHHHRIIVKASQIARLNTTRVPCISNLSELGWIVKVQQYLSQNEIYTLKLCERIQIAEWSLRRKQCAAEKFEENGLPVCHEGSIVMLRESLQKEFPCRPPCSSLEWRCASTYTRIPNGIKISIEYRETKEVLTEIRKMDVTDVLSFIGGGTSLFLGCSCVTLMETFIFLFKLVVQSISSETFESVRVEDDCSKNSILGPVSATKLETKTTESDVDEEGDAIASTMQSPPRKSIHCVRLLTTEEDEEKKTRGPLYRPHPPSLSELKKSSAFNELNTHTIERSLRNLPLSQRLTFDGAMERRHLRRQCAVDVTDDKLDQYLSEPTDSQSLCDNFDRKHPARVKVRRISSVTSRGSSSSTRTNVHIVEHPRRRSQIFNKFMAMNDF